jgi:hypothetical protein
MMMDSGLTTEHELSNLFVAYNDIPGLLTLSMLTMSRIHREIPLSLRLTIVRSYGGWSGL